MHRKNVNYLTFYMLFALAFLYVNPLVCQSFNNTKHAGYRGIWFTLGQTEKMMEVGYEGKYGDKYSTGKALAWSHTVAPMESVLI